MKTSDNDGTALTAHERAAMAQAALFHLAIAWRNDWSDFDGRTLRDQLNEIAGWLSPGARVPSTIAWADSWGIDLETGMWR